MSDWPSGLVLKPIVTWPGELTKSRTHSPFTRRLNDDSYRRAPMPLRDTTALLGRELRYLNAKTPVMEIALEERFFRIDGYPRAGSKPAHPGVIISFTSSDVGDQQYPCDTFLRWEDNLRAIALAMEALRKVERYGVDKRNARYMGFKALPGGIATPPPMTRDCAAEVIAKHAHERFSPEQVLTSAAIRRVAVKMGRGHLHPDRGGDPAAWAELDRAVRVFDQ